MTDEYTLYRLDILRRSIRLLRETIDVNFPPNDAVEQSLQNCELEATLLAIQLHKEK